MESTNLGSGGATHQFYDTIDTGIVENIINVGDEFGGFGHGVITFLIDISHADLGDVDACPYFS